MVKPPARRKPRTFPDRDNAKAVDLCLQGDAGALSARLRKTRKALLPPAAGEIKRSLQTPAERWQSGRMRRSRKPLSVQADPGFESLSLRHIFLAVERLKSIKSNKYQNICL